MNFKSSLTTETTERKKLMTDLKNSECSEILAVFVTAEEMQVSSAVRAAERGIFKQHTHTHTHTHTCWVAWGSRYVGLNNKGLAIYSK